MYKVTATKWSMILKGIFAIAKKINELIEEESSEHSLKQKLVDLQIGFEANEITEEEYDRQEEELLDKLEAIRIQKEQQEK
jgi:hypothetical protein